MGQRRNQSQEKFFNIFEKNKNRYVWNAAKVVLRVKFIANYLYQKKRKKVVSNQ